MGPLIPILLTRTTALTSPVSLTCCSLNLLKTSSSTRSCRSSEDEWDMTPAVPGGNRTPALGGTSGGGGGGGSRRPPSSSASAWTSGNDTQLPEAAVPGGGSSARPGGSSRAGGAAATPGHPGGGRVRFDLAPSPALTPTWKSTSWNRSALGAKVGGGGGGGGVGEDVERSPDLKPGMDQQGADFDEQVGGDGSAREERRERD